MDAFSRLLAHSSAHASLFFAGRLCGESHSEDYPSGGQLHLLRAGELMLHREGEPPLLLQEPTLIFYPVPCHHRLIPRTLGGCDLVCASLHFGEEGASALRSALPDQLLLPLRELPALAPLLQLLFDEAFGEAQGREAILGRLVDLLLVYLLRHIQGAGLYRGGDTGRSRRHQVGSRHRGDA
ncbi:cupin domain-containing protein [Aeromonas schubertii]